MAFMVQAQHAVPPQCCPTSRNGLHHRSVDVAYPDIQIESCPLLADRLHLRTSGTSILTYSLEKTCWEGAHGWASQKQEK